MAGPAIATGPDPDAAASVDASVGFACLAAGLLVAQQVAAKATRDALFLSNFPVTTLPIASGLTAGVSLAGVLAFSRGMARSSPPVMMRWVLGVSAILLIGEWSLSLAAPRLAAVAVYFHVGLFGATLVSGFWSVINESFDPYTARHVIGRIGTGAGVGGVVGGLLTWRAAGLIGVAPMLLVIVGLTLACLIVLETLHRTDRGRVPPAAPAVRPGPAYALRLIRREPYLRNVAVLVGLCALTEAVLDYVLSAAVTTRFGRGGPLMSFFALYHTSVGVVALGLQTALARRALERLGLGGTLAVPPVVITLGAALAAIVPGVWPRVAVRGVQAVLRNSLFRSAYELLYTPLAPERKRPTKALLDVGADRLGTIAGSAVVMLILLLPAAGATRMLLLLASALAAASLVLTRRLQKGYVSALAESLRAGTVRLDPIDVVDQTTRATLAIADAQQRRITAEQAKAPHPADAGTEPSLDADADASAALRSGDPGRIRGVLTREAVLEPALVSLVVPLLARDELFTEAVAALRRVAARCTGQLLDVLLDPEQDPIVRRRVPRVLKAAPTQRAVDGLLAALRDERFDVRYRSAQALLRLRQRDGALRIPASDAFSAAQRELTLARASPRGLEHVFGLLSLGVPGEPLAAALRAWRTDDRSLRGTALEYLQNVLPATVWGSLWPWLGSRPAATGRTLDEMRDDLLRSTAASESARRSKRRATGSAGGRGPKQ
jgi:AAA family ATP:ADP antiporter